MKKVLALVLAVIMVCTMAMATTVEAVTVSGVTSDTFCQGGFKKFSRNRS